MIFLVRFFNSLRKKNADECEKLKEVANTRKVQNQETKISLDQNDEWKPAMSNAGQITVVSSTEVGKPVIQVQVGRGVLTAGHVPETQSSHQH